MMVLRGGQWWLERGGGCEIHFEDLGGGCSPLLTTAAALMMVAKRRKRRTVRRILVGSDGGYWRVPLPFIHESTIYLCDISGIATRIYS